MRNRVCFAVLACVFAAAAMSHAAWQPGLWGGFNTAGTAAYTTPPIYTNTYLGMHCATNYISSTSTHTNPVPIWSNNRCWQYWGQIYLPTGTTTFGADIDDNSQLKIDGTTVFTQSGNNKTSGTVAFDAPGWHDFLFTCGNGSGAAGPYGNIGLEQQTIGGMTVGVGFGMKLPGETNWAFPTDPGNRSLFRYDDGLGFEDRFTIAGVPTNIGEPDPDYGTYDGVANGSNLTMSVASGTDVITVEDGQRACCTGYVWYAVNIETWEKTLVAAAPETYFDYTHSNMAEVVWLWCVSNRTVVTAGAGGSVVAGGVSGSSLTNWDDSVTGRLDIEAIPAEGHVFYKWTGDIGTADSRNPEISVDFSQARTINAVFSDMIYVSTNGANIAPYNSWADAATNITDALVYADAGDIVQIGAGNFDVGPSITVTNGIKLQGAGVDKTILKGGSRSGTGCFYIQNAEADLCDFTLDGVTWNKDDRKAISPAFNLTAGYLHDLRINAMNVNATGNMYGLGIKMSGGRVADVLIENCTSTRGDMNCNGCAIYQTGGLVERCVLRNNQGKQYGALYLAGGTNAHAIIYGNTARNGGATGGGVSMTGGVLKHATLWGNRAGNDPSDTGATGGGLWHNNGIVTNCIAWNNSLAPMSGEQTYGPDVYSSATTKISSLCAPSACGVNPITAYPEFTDPAGGDFSLRSSSPCLLAGGGYVGAEPFNGLAVGMTVSPRETFPDTNVTFTATARDVASPAYSWVVTDAAGVTSATSTAQSFSQAFTTGWYSVRLEVKDGAASAGTDVRPRFLHVGAYTNWVAVGDDLVARIADAIDGETYLLADGKHTLTNTVPVLKNVKLIGSGADHCVIARPSEAVLTRAMQINHPDALVTGVAITGGRLPDSYRSTYGCGVWIGARGGTLSWCTITNNTTSGHWMRGGGAAMTGTKGRLSHCIIAKNSTSNGVRSNYGGGLYLSAGEADNCLIAGNTSYNGGGIALAGSGKVRNCTIAVNTAYTLAGGLYWWNATAGSAEIRNTVLANDVCTADATLGRPEWAPETANATQYKNITNAFFQCAFKGSAIVGTGAQFLVDPFADAEYRMKLSSTAVNNGGSYEGLADEDLDGNTRVQGGTVDIGCYEVDTSVFACSIKVDQAQVLTEVPVTLTAVVSGLDGVSSTANWKFYTGGTLVAEETGNPLVVSFSTDGVYKVALTVTRADTGATAEDVDDNCFYVGPRRIDVAPGASINDAVARSIAGTHIYLAAGVHTVTGTVTLAGAISVTGAGMSGCVVSNVSADAVARVFTLNHPDALLEDVTITRGRIGNNNDNNRNLYGCGVWIAANGGTARRCRATRNYTNTHYNRGGGFGMTGNGLIENCIADHNSTMYGTKDSYGGGIAAENGKVVNCLVYANNSVRGAGIAALGPAEFYNCTVVTNTAIGSYDGTVGGVYSSSTGAKFYNMIFADNVALTTKSYTGKPCWYGVTAGQVTACAFPVGIAVPSSAEGACYSLDPRFSNKAAEDWRLSATSPAINKGVWNEAWGLTGTDLLGNPRLKAKKVDLGCYECQTGGLTLIVK